LFHDFTIIILIFITILIFFIAKRIINNKFINRFLLQGHLIELICTIISIFILIFIAKRILIQNSSKHLKILFRTNLGTSRAIDMIGIFVYIFYYFYISISIKWTERASLGIMLFN